MTGHDTGTETEAGTEPEAETADADVDADVAVADRAASPHDRFDVDGEAHRCPHCDWPFTSEHLLTLHLGEVHPDDLTPKDLAGYEAAREREHDDLFVFHLKVVAAFTVLLFAFIYTYAFVWAG